MRRTFRSIVAWMKRQPLLQPLRPIVRSLTLRASEPIERAAVLRWQLHRGPTPIPPPHPYKVAVVRSYARRFRTPVLVETGTYLGQMVRRVRRSFKRIWSVELDDALFARASELFQSETHINIVHGDSSAVLPEILRAEAGPILFWLDGHWSGGVTARGNLDTPIIAELSAVLSRSGDRDVILIDDAREFGKGDYPSLSTVKAMIKEKRPRWQVEIRNDVLRAHR